MFKYAEIYGGKVRDIKESHLNFVEFCSIFDPASFWLDVTGVDNIGIGWILKSNPEIGTYFEEPEVPQEQDINSRKAAKLEILKARFLEIIDSAFVISSLGFRADAGQRAYRDVNGLITQMEEEGISTKNFRDYDNIVHALTLAGAKTLRLEIIKNGEFLYHQKWDYEQRIARANSSEDLDAMFITFNMMDFS